MIILLASHVVIMLKIIRFCEIFIMQCAGLVKGYHNSVCMLICLFVTLHYFVEKSKRIIRHFRLPDSPIVLVYLYETLQ